MSYVSITGLDRAEVLAALFNASRQQGMGFIHREGQSQMSVSQAREELRNRSRFDYLRGRVMKIDLGEEPMFTAMYDRDNGSGAAERIINGLRLRSAGEEEVRRRRDDNQPSQAPWPYPTQTDDANGFETIREAEPAHAPTFASGNGGDFGGGGASSSWEPSAPAPSPSESCSASSYSDSSSSSSSDSGTSGGSGYGG